MDNEIAGGLNGGNGKRAVVVLAVAAALIFAVIVLVYSRRGVGKDDEMLMTTTEIVEEGDTEVVNEVGVIEDEDDSSVLEISVDAGSYYFDPKEIVVKKGQKVRLTLTSKDMMHNFIVDELSINVPITKSGDSSVVEFVADKVGRFEYYCSVASHRKLGQVGTLVVEE